MKLPGPLTDVATIKTLLRGAEDEARAAGDGLPGPEHLVLSALALPDGSARECFDRVGADPDAFRAAIEESHRAALGAVGVAVSPDLATPVSPARPGAGLGPAGPFRSTPAAQQVFQAAVRSSKRRKPSRFRGADVVVAACDLEQGTVARALNVLGVDRSALAAAARFVLAAG